MIEKIEELLRAEPFTPFRLIMSSANYYDVLSPYQIAIGASYVAYLYPKSDKEAHLRKTELTTIETIWRG